MAQYLRLKNCKEKEPISNMLTSDNPELRKLARRIRIKKRIEHYNPKPEKPPKKSAAELQMERSMDKIMKLLNSSYLSVTNIRVAAVKADYERQKKQVEEQKKIRCIIRNEAIAAHKKFIEINNKWKVISEHNDPLDIHNDTNDQRDKCLQLLEEKDDIIQQLKDNLTESDVLFFNELEQQNEYINILSDRVNSQIFLMNECFRLELERLERVINREKEVLLKKRRRHFEQISKEKEQLELDNLKGKFLVIRDHENEMDKMLVEQQETMRAVKLEINKKKHKLILDLDGLRNVCMINAEKLNYNYHVLQKREGENRLIKSQQKRVINQLQEAVSSLRKKANAEQAGLGDQIKKLRKELHHLHQNVKDTDYRAHLFAQSSSKKYFQLWDYNQKIVETLVGKIVAADKVFYDFELCIPWRPPQITFSKEDMPSYIDAKRVLKELKGYVGIERKLPPMTIEQKNRLLKIIMDSIQDKVDFLMEDSVKYFIEPLSHSDKKLVTLETLFLALGVKENEDIDYISKFFLPYVECSECAKTFVQQQHELEDEKETYIDGIVGDELHFNEHAHKIRPILDIVSEKVRNQFDITNIVVKNEFTSAKGAFELTVLDDEYTLRKESLPRETDIIHKQDVLGFNTKGSPTLPLILNDPQETTKKEKLKLKALETKEIVMKNDQRLAQLMCTEPGHRTGLNPMHVCKALKEFSVKFNEEKGGTELNPSLSFLGKKRNLTLPCLLRPDDVEAFWRKYCNIFTKDKISLWNALLIQMKDYYRILLRRHYLNEEIKLIKGRNAEMRQLLQRYLHPMYESTQNKDLQTRLMRFFEEQPPVIYPNDLIFNSDSSSHDLIPGTMRSSASISSSISF